MIKAIIFDCAGVILSEGYWGYLRKNIPDIEKKHDFFMELSKKADLDTITEKEFAETIAKEANTSPEVIEENIIDEFVPNLEVFSLMEKLRKKYAIGFLSNFHKTWIKVLFKKFDLAKYFDAIVVSADFGVIKPDPKIYHITLGKLGVKPEEAIFIDDRQLNVDGAKNVGMEGIVYTSYSALIKDLKNLGVTV